MTKQQGLIRKGQMSADRVNRRISQPGPIRTLEVDGAPACELLAVRYGVVDDYGSVWESGCLSRGWSERLPQLAHSHDRDLAQGIIGRAVPGLVETEMGPIATCRFADFDKVPSASIVHALIADGIVDECSIGFRWGYAYRTPNKDEQERWPDCFEIITEAFVSEISIVMEGAVPGAKVLTVRDKPKSRVLPVRMGNVVTAETAGQVAAQLAAGDIDLLTALTQIKDASVAGDIDELDDKPDEEDTGDDDEGGASVPATPPDDGGDDDGGAAPLPTEDPAIAAEIDDMFSDAGEVLAGVGY